MILKITRDMVKPIEKLNGEHITVEDFRHLYTNGPEKISFAAMSLIFGVDVADLYIFAKQNKITVRKEDYYSMRGIQERHNAIVEKSEREFEEKQRQRDKEIWEEAEQIYGKPKPEVTVTVIRGKPFRDTDLLKAYYREVKKIFKTLKNPNPRGASEKKFIRSVDLSAMRLHRGLDMVAFAEKSKLPYKTILYYEKTKYVMVPKEVSDVYFQVLNISRVEFKRIIDCLSGKRKDMHEEESRVIPDSVKKYVFDRDGGKCRKCGRNEYLHFHHKEYYSNGGKHQARNLKLLCVACHAEEHYGEPGYGLLKAQAEKLLGVKV